MRKLPLLILLMAVIAPLKAHALLGSDEVLSYVAMPLAVSDVCDIRGTQTDQVASLVSYMDQAQVSPEGFIDVFRYVPVALVFNSGRRPDFVQWVGGQVSQGVMGDELVTVMERRLTTYGNVVPASETYRHRRYRRNYWAAAFEPDYVPVYVRRYCESELLDPYALIDMPVAVAEVVDLGVPYDRVGRLVVELNLGNVEPFQTVELLRYAPPALYATNYYGQPDFVQYVYDQRVSGLSGYPLVQVVDRQLSAYGVAPQIDLVSPAYIGTNAYVPTVVQNYVPPTAPTYVPQVVRSQVASGFAAGSASFTPAAPSVVTASPQVQRLLGAQGGSAVVVNPAEARRELARSSRAEREAARMANAPPAGFPAAMAPPQHGRGHEMTPTGPGFVTAPAPGVATARGGEGRHGHVATPGGMRSFEQPAAIEHRRAEGGGEDRHGRGGGHEHIAAPPQVEQPHGRPQFVPQPTMAAPPSEQQHGHGHGHGGPAPQAESLAPQPFVQQGNGHGHGHGETPPQAVVAVPQPSAQQGNGHGHGGPPPQQAVAPAPQPSAQPGNGHGQGGPPEGKSQGKKKGKEQ